MFNSGNSEAHSPHDVIEVVEISPVFSKDHTIFICMLDLLKKSTDGGHSWEKLVYGLDNRYPFSSIVISSLYESNQTVYISSDGDGVYRSEDGGVSWKKANYGFEDLNIKLLSIFHSAGKDFLLAASSSGGLYKTSNNGKSWSKVLEKILISAIAVYRHKDHHLIIAGSANGHLFVSKDLGDSWRFLNKDNKWGSINSIAFSAKYFTDGTVYIGTEKKGVFKSTDKGNHFVSTNQGLPVEAHIRSLVTSNDPKLNTTVFASTWYEAVFYTKNGGENWHKIENGLSSDHQADSIYYRSPHFRDIKLSNNFYEDKSLFLGGFDGLFKSSNGGENWIQLETFPLKAIKGISINSNRKKKISIGVVTYGGGIYFSEDKGHTWNIRNKGLKKTRLTDIAFSHEIASKNTTFAAYKNCIIKSTDQGRNWIPNEIVTKSWKERIDYYIKKKTHKSKMLKKIGDFIRTKLSHDAFRPRPYPTVIKLSPNYSRDGIIFFGTRSDGLYVSNDRGKKFRLLWKGKENRTITSLAISPDYQFDKTLFCSLRGKGIFKSTDGGDTWRSANIGLNYLLKWKDFQKFLATRINDTFIGISPGFKFDKTLFAGSSEGLYKSTNGGEDWNQLEGEGIGSNSYIMSLAISPNFIKDNTLIISVRGKGVFLSLDAGNHFTQIAQGSIIHTQEIRWIEFSNNYQEDNIIAIASEEGLFISDTKGNSWKMLNNRPFRYEDNREIIQYQGKWSIERNDEYSASTVSKSDTEANSAMLNFIGRSIVLIGPKAPNMGISKVFIDGKFVTDVDQYSRNRSAMLPIYRIDGLSASPHTVKIVVSGNKSPYSKGAFVAIDAFDVLP